MEPYCELSECPTSGKFFLKIDIFCQRLFLYYTFTLLALAELCWKSLLLYCQRVMWFIYILREVHLMWRFEPRSQFHFWVSVVLNKTFFDSVCWVMLVTFDVLQSYFLLCHSKSYITRTRKIGGGGGINFRVLHPNSLFLKQVVLLRFFVWLLRV